MSTPSPAVSRTTLVVGGSVVAVAAVGALLYVGLSGGGDTTAAAPIVHRTAAVTPSGAASAVPSPSALAPVVLSTRNPFAVPSPYRTLAAPAAAAAAPAAAAPAAVAPVAAATTAAAPATPYVELRSVTTDAKGNAAVTVVVNNTLIRDVSPSTTTPLGGSPFFYTGTVTTASGTAYQFAYGTQGKNLTPDAGSDQNNPVAGAGTMLCASSGCTGGVS